MPILTRIFCLFCAAASLSCVRAESAVASTSSVQDASEAALAPKPREFGFSPHEPLYFSVGLRKAVDAKFQLSFKFRPVGPSDDRVAGKTFLENLYASFTQTSLWDLDKPSAPFRDSSYKPAIFHHLHKVGKVLGGEWGYAAGLEHESNGKDGVNSRSINFAFVRPTIRWNHKEWEWCVSPRFLVYLEKEDNEDITQYRGYAEFNAWVGQRDSWRVAALGRVGRHSEGRGSLQIDVSYPFAKINRAFPTGWVHGYLHFQYFTGWGESLLEYRQRRPSQVRLGFMALR